MRWNEKAEGLLHDENRCNDKRRDWRELWFSTITSQPPVARKFASRSLFKAKGRIPQLLSLLRHNHHPAPLRLPPLFAATSA